MSRDARMRPARRGEKPTALVEGLRNLRAEGAGQLLRRLRVAGAWRATAGSPLSLWSRVSWYDPSSHTVTVVVRSERWRRGLDSHSATLLEALSAASGERAERLELLVDEGAFKDLLPDPPAQTLGRGAARPLEGGARETSGAPALSARAAPGPPASLREALELLRDRYIAASSRARD